MYTRSEFARQRSVLRIIVIFIILGHLQSPGFAASFTPPKGKTLLQIGQNNRHIMEYIKQTNDIPAGTMTYTTIHTFSGLEEPVSWVNPETNETIPNQMDFHVWHTDYDNVTIQIGMWMCGSSNQPNNEEHLVIIPYLSIQ